MDADSGDEEPDGLSLDEHELARKQAELALAAETGNEIVQKGERLSDTVTWTVVSSNLEINTGRAFLPATNVGLVTGLPFRQGEPDLLKLWLQLYHGDIDKDIAQLNSLLRSRGHRDITQHEYVKFWGLIIAARQFSEKGKNARMQECSSPRRARMQECGVALCVKNNSANSRDCFGKHQRASQEELRMLTATANIRTTKRQKTTTPTEQP